VRKCLGGGVRCSTTSVRPDMATSSMSLPLNICFSLDKDTFSRVNQRLSQAAQISGLPRGSDSNLAMCPRPR